jgi:hypothetical protein
MYRSVICLWLFLAGMGSLLAIGYTSALVTTEDEFLAATKTFEDSAPPPAVPNTVGLGTGGIAPMADTTTRFGLWPHRCHLIPIQTTLFISAVGAMWRKRSAGVELAISCPKLAQTLIER